MILHNAAPGALLAVPIQTSTSARIYPVSQYARKRLKYKTNRKAHNTNRRYLSTKFIKNTKKKTKKKKTKNKLGSPKKE